MKAKLKELKALEKTVSASPDKQVSLTDPDARAMSTSLKASGVVGYNVQAAVDTEHHLIVAHEMTNAVHDREQLAGMARKTKAAFDADEITVFADRGYFSGEQIKACVVGGVTPYVPKPYTSNSKAAGRFGKYDFTYDAGADVYHCPAGEKLTYRYTNVEAGCTLGPTGPMSAAIVRSRRSAPRARSAVCAAGSMKTSSTTCFGGSMRCPTRRRSEGGRSSTRSVHSNPGWDRVTC